eukprot:6185978-Pleurochrysis_carterae.AAC.1
MFRHADLAPMPRGHFGARCSFAPRAKPLRLRWVRRRPVWLRASQAAASRGGVSDSGRGGARALGRRRQEHEGWRQDVRACSPPPPTPLSPASLEN